MGSKLSRRQQVDFLKAHGFTPAEGDVGKGSHEMWVNNEFNRLAAKYNVEIPPNLAMGKTIAQKSAALVLPSDAGAGTWARIEKLTLWCDEKAAEMLKQEAAAQFGKSKNRPSGRAAADAIEAAAATFLASDMEKMEAHDAKTGAMHIYEPDTDIMLTIAKDGTKTMKTSAGDEFGVLEQQFGAKVVGAKPSLPQEEKSRPGGHGISATAPAAP